MVVRNLWTGTVGSGIVFPVSSHWCNGKESRPLGTYVVHGCRDYLSRLFEPEEVERLTDDEVIELVAD